MKKTCVLIAIAACVGLASLDRSAAEEKEMSLEELAHWLEVEAKRQVEGCRRLAHDGFTQCFTPDGGGRYGALWTRDFCYVMEGYPDAVSTVDFRNAVLYLINGVRADGVAPDRVQTDGLAVYSAGGVGHPLGEPPTDNAQFLVKLADLLVARTGDVGFFRQNSDVLEKTMKSIPRRADGLVFIDPAGPRRSPYGFTDCIRKTGAVLFSSLLYWEACGCMSRLHAKAGNAEDSKRWHKEAERIEKALDLFWNKEEGILLAATDGCRQPDVWGSAYAVFIGAVSDERADSIARWLDANYDRIVLKGMTRHVLEPEGWQQLLVGRKADSYQNGGYWPVPAPWMARALRRVNPQRARQMLIDLLDHMRQNGVNEWENESGAVGVRDYVASATLPLIAVREELAGD